jgi:hypothetical protein
MATSLYNPGPVSSRVDEFLAGVKPPPLPPRTGRLAFIIDATGSRESSWDRAAKLQTEMFHEVAKIGGLHIKLIHFGGVPGIDIECVASEWLPNAVALAARMVQVRCRTGETQIARALGHVLEEPIQPKIGAVVYIGDACEERRENLLPAAQRLAARGTPLFIFQEGNGPHAESIFRELTKISGGAFSRFDANSAKQLGELLRAAALFATGGRLALEQQGSPAAKLLLNQLR